MHYWVACYRTWWLSMSQKEYWANFLLLLRVVDLLTAPQITEDEVACLSLWVTEHHITFVELYPNETVTPKMHYMVHMPRLILK